MGTVTYAIPTVGQPNSTEDPKVATALTQIANTLNGNIDGSNIAAALGALMFNPGDLKVTAGTATPGGFLPCDGSAVSRTTFGALFAAIGVAWGSGDGATTFNLPDYRGKTIVGAGAGAGLTVRTVGQTLGEESHVLSTVELAPHNHGVNDPGHEHGFSGATLLEAGSSGAAALASGPVLLGGLTQTAGAATGISTQNAGSGTGHNNMQPSAVASVFIKT
jgi:microcystin-dependent protein